MSPRLFLHPLSTLAEGFAGRLRENSMAQLILGGAALHTLRKNSDERQFFGQQFFCRA
jgi:hypothetical protein